MVDDCLSGHTLVQLHLHSSSGHPIKIEPNVQQSKYSIQVTATQQDSHTAKSKDVLLKILRKHDCVIVKDHHNSTFEENDFFIYSTLTEDISSLVFKIEVNRGLDSATAVVGFGYLTSYQMAGSTGSVMVLLHNEHHQYVGMITVGYLLIHPCQHPLSSSTHEESKRSRGISAKKSSDQYYVCGHRGAGESFSGSSPYPENTISAFRAASYLGIDFVEMDVQVSKDKIPVVFHDTVVKLNLQKSASGTLTIIEIPVKDLTIEQMTNAKIDEDSYPRHNEKVDQLTIDNQVIPSEEADFQLFPTLGEVFDRVPESTGFLLEMKYALAEMGGDKIDGECMDENEFVDAILEVVFDKAMNRKIILASFDANICALSQLKQNDFPVFFITQDNTTIWTPYLDIRTQHIDAAIAFAKAQHLDGIHSFSKELLESPEKIDRVLEAGLVLSVWGSPNEDIKTRQWLHEHGVHCIQVDDISDVSTKTR